MSRSVQVQLPTGDIVWARVETEGPSDVAAGGLLKLDPDDLRKTLRGVSESVRGALVDLTPDQLQIEFGLQLTAKSGKITSMLAEAGATASIKVSMTWVKDTAAATEVAAEPGDTKN
jgi:hypothetical protein